jgi:hypothetical protein
MVGKPVIYNNYKNPHIMNELIYKIYSVWLYQNQLKHDWVFFYNRKPSYYSVDLDWSAPYEMFSSSDWSANTKIWRLDKNDPDRENKSIEIMKEAAKKAGLELISAKDFITLNPIGESQISYSGAFLPGEKLEIEGKYKGLKKNIYTPYEILWNETLSGVNPHEFEVMGVWNSGESSYSSYRIWEEKVERLKAIREYKLEILGIK